MNRYEDFLQPVRVRVDALSEESQRFSDLVQNAKKSAELVEVRTGLMLEALRAGTDCNSLLAKLRTSFEIERSKHDKVIKEIRTDFDRKFDQHKKNKRKLSSEHEGTRRKAIDRIRFNAEREVSLVIGQVKAYEDLAKRLAVPIRTVTEPAANDFTFIDRSSPTGPSTFSKAVEEASSARSSLGDTTLGGQINVAIGSFIVGLIVVMLYVGDWVVSSFVAAIIPTLILGLHFWNSKRAKTAFELLVQSAENERRIIGKKLHKANDESKTEFAVRWNEKAKQLRAEEDQIQQERSSRQSHEDARFEKLTVSFDETVRSFDKELEEQALDLKALIHQLESTYPRVFDLNLVDEDLAPAERGSLNQHTGLLVLGEFTAQPTVQRVDR